MGVTLELYDHEDQIGVEVRKIQWLDSNELKGRRVLVVDEVDDTRTTLDFCVRELQANTAGAPDAIGVLVRPAPEPPQLPGMAL